MDSPSLQAAASLHQIRARWRSDIPGFSRWNNEGSPKVRRIHARRSSMCSPFETVTPTVRSNFGQSISAFGSRAISSDQQIARFKRLSRNSRSHRARRLQVLPASPCLLKVRVHTQCATRMVFSRAFRTEVFLAHRPKTSPYLAQDRTTPWNRHSEEGRYHGWLK